MGAQRFIERWTILQSIVMFIDGLDKKKAQEKKETLSDDKEDHNLMQKLRRTCALCSIVLVFYFSRHGEMCFARQPRILNTLFVSGALRSSITFHPKRSRADSALRRELVEELKLFLISIMVFQKGSRTSTGRSRRTPLLQSCSISPI
jgi:hypothetical protein